MAPTDRSRLVVLTGCSGGGKSSLLAEFAGRGYPVVEEPGRRAARSELAGAGVVLPWTDGEAFARRIVAIAAVDLLEVAPGAGWTFFDRGLVDSAAALAHARGEPLPLGDPALRGYHRQVFLAPPWQAIYVTDAERRHSFAAAAAEYDRLVTAYTEFGYTLIELPRATVAERANLVRHDRVDVSA